jgi:uncharacterized secreted protein with C-terminal beta-propeller domain
MIYSKKMLVATFFMATILFVNLSMANMYMANMNSENADSRANKDPDSLSSYLENDFVIVKGEDGNLFLVPEGLLENGTLDSFDEVETEAPDTPFAEDEESENINRFSDFDELKEYLEYESDTELYYSINSNFRGGTALIGSSFKSSEMIMGDGRGDSLFDYSSTNNQVAGVDEGDILKHDGKYVYIVSKDRNSVFILDVTPPLESRFISYVNTTGRINEIYLNGDTLIVLGYRKVFLIDPFLADSGTNSVLLENGKYYYFSYISYTATFLEIYDVSVKENPVLEKTHIWRGSFIGSRMIGDHVYVISTQRIYNNLKPWDLPASPSEIYYFNDTSDDSKSSDNHEFLSVKSVDIIDLKSKPNSRVVLMSSSNDIYVSQNNIYITNTYWRYGSENTTIHRISIQNGEITYKAKGEVPGSVLNRFSMDEHGEYFRIATTVGWSGSTAVYILDLDMDIAGSVEGIAPGEHMYSARFMGNRAYLVTFKKVDPFFVINLTDPENPYILGELKIPGYSDYLHPYDENHVIGLGKDTHDMGDFAWYQGVKLSLFDVTDVLNPKEVSKYIIGDRGTYSPALSDPHAFLFSKNKNLLVIPIILYEINRTRNPNPSPSTHGDYTWHGAYVFNITAENGFVLKGTLDHPEEEKEEPRSRYYRNCDSEIKRSFYIGKTLYTLSNDYLKMNDMDDLEEINIFEFPKKDDLPPSPPVICLEVGQIRR